MSVNTNSVHFGTIVIAEKSLRKIQLINKGALGTNFEVLKLSEFKKKSKEEKTENETTESSIELGEVCFYLMCLYLDMKIKTWKKI